MRLWFSFEQFVRRVVVAYLDEFISRKTDFDTLEKYGLARKNLQYTGAALQHIVENRPNLSVDFFSIAKNAATSIPGSTKVDLNTALFSLFLAGPSPEGLQESLKRIGVNFSWDDLGRHPAVQKALQLRGARDAAKAAEAFLKDTVKRRHNIVHKADNIEQVTESDVVEALAKISAIGTALLDFLKNDCEQKCR